MGWSDSGCGWGLVSLGCPHVEAQLKRQQYRELALPVAAPRSMRGKTKPPEKEDAFDHRQSETSRRFVPECQRSERRTRKQTQAAFRIRQALRDWRVTTKTRHRVRVPGSCEKSSWEGTIWRVSHCLYYPCLLLTVLLVLSCNKEVLSPWCGPGCGLNAGGHQKQDRCSLERQATGPSLQCGRC